jgi:flagellum-specific ATP synthase
MDIKKRRNDQGRLIQARGRIQSLGALELVGAVASVTGLSARLEGLDGHLAIGDRIRLCGRGGREVVSEVVGFHADGAQSMPFGTLEGLGTGAEARLRHRHLHVAPLSGPMLFVSPGWLGRVVNPLGAPVDGQGPLPPGEPRPVRAGPPDAGTRGRLGPRLDLGVRALNCFATCREGQRMGLFAGSGVGKSTLLGMLARHTACDVAVVALVGERGREVREFIEDELGPEGLARSVVIVATSDSPPLMRREAAYAAMTVAEYFRDQGQSVLLMMDSVTRFCLALREIGLSAGEPPATRGYPPSVFAELPRLLERAGPGAEPSGGGLPGFITGLFTVLVEGDDHNEPVADSVRGILDGHVILDRRIGERGRYPAMDVLRSLSRTVPGCNQPEENALARRARSILALHAEMADLVRLGAYHAGSDPAVDEALRVAPRIEAVLQQRHERSDIEESFAMLERALDGADEGATDGA